MARRYTSARASLLARYWIKVAIFSLRPFLPVRDSAWHQPVENLSVYRSSRVLPKWIFRFSTRGLPHSSPTIFRFFNDRENRPLYNAGIPWSDSFHFDLVEMHATTARSHEIANVWSFFGCRIVRCYSESYTGTRLGACWSTTSRWSTTKIESSAFQIVMKALATTDIISFHDNDTQNAGMLNMNDCLFGFLSMSLIAFD